MLLIDPNLVSPLQGDFSAVRFHGLGNPALPQYLGSLTKEYVEEMQRTRQKDSGQG